MSKEKPVGEEKPCPYRDWHGKHFEKSQIFTPEEMGKYDRCIACKVRFDKDGKPMVDEFKNDLLRSGYTVEEEHGVGHCFTGGTR